MHSIVHDKLILDIIYMVWFYILMVLEMGDHRLHAMSWHEINGGCDPDL